MKLTKQITRKDYGRDVTSTRPTRAGWTVAAIAASSVIAAPIAYLVSTSTVPQDSVGVVVGGGPLDPSKKKVKGNSIEAPGRIWHGALDKVFTYPNAQTVRFQDYEVAVTTKDGKSVVLAGNLGFRFGARQQGTRWVADSDAVMAFARGVGARQYGENRRRPGEGIDAFADFLNVMVVPEILAATKEQIGRAYCADFEPSCRVIDPRADVPETAPESVYQPLAKAIEQRVTRKLGGAYLTDFRLVVKSVQLTQDVQSNINNLAAEQARTRAAEQSEKTARAEARAIKIKGEALRSNQSLVGVEIVKSCGGQCTVILDGTGKVNGTSVATR